jgi:hypothetical protein
MIYKKWLFCFSLCLIFISGCIFRNTLKSTNQVSKLKLISERIIWSTYPERPEWIVKETYSEGEFLIFVGLSEKHSTEREARDIALRDARDKATQYMGVSVRDEFQRVQKSYGVSSDIINPDTSAKRFEEQFSKAVVRRMKANEWYCEKYELEYIKNITETAWQCFVRANIPKEEVDREIQEAVRKQEELNMSAARALEIFSQNSLGRASFNIEIWPDKGSGAIYKEGEKIIFNFRASKDCYVYLYLLNAAGDIVALFPYGNEDNYVKANRIYTIPPENLNLSFTASAPFGNETVKAFATIKPIPELRRRTKGDADEIFYGVGKVYSDEVKDIVRAIKLFGPESISENITTFSVLKQ